MRTAATLQDLTDAMAKLPSPYAHGRIRAPYINVAMMEPLRYSALTEPFDMTTSVRHMTFEIEELRSSDGTTWKRWVYRGSVTQ